ncbi:MAG: MerR family transcriptional regulator [Betaproteobacteria bacterium]|nr:MerR family transcriptional regulator [Betaproteobacteria bacterium]
MNETKSSMPSPLPATGASALSLHRSGAVARMLRMPVATLRVWERRYRLTQPALTPSGQRLYSADDIRRLALIKQLTDLGHAIGSLAALDMPQLQHVASTHAQALATTQRNERSDVAHAPPVRAWRLAVVGAPLGKRLQRPALLRRLDRPVVLLGPFDDIAQAAAGMQGSHLDALLFHEPQLHEGWLAAVEAAAPALAGVPKEPQPDAVVAQWLNSLSAKAAAAPQSAVDRPTPGADPAPPRRWNDAALADFANLSSTIACECPRHVTELLMQLSHFEAYSAECEHLNAADAELHAYLRQVATDSRTRFEAALEHVALHEGLLLPSSAKADDAVVARDPQRAGAVTAVTAITAIPDARPGHQT